MLSTPRRSTCAPLVLAYPFQLVMSPRGLAQPACLCSNVADVCTPRGGTQLGALNVANRTLFVGDNLPILLGINSESVDLIATDPPFNKDLRDFEGITKAGKNHPSSDRKLQEKTDAAKPKKDKWT